MDHHTRNRVITGNWKMNKTMQEAVQFVKELQPQIQINTTLVYLAVPFTAIKSVSEAIVENKIVVGAQNMNDASQGAFTGEIAAQMIIEAGAKFVLIGHSERRHIFHESDDFIHKKVIRALKDGLQPVLCVGETLEERGMGKTEEKVLSQLESGLKDVSEDQIGKVMLAYEPVWAIGTGVNASPEDANDMHQLCRKFISQKWGDKAGQGMIIQYGGSVKPENAKDYLSQPEIDGLLVGGASLSLDSFIKIINDSK